MMRNNVLCYSLLITADPVFVRGISLTERKKYLRFSSTLILEKFFVKIVQFKSCLKRTEQIICSTLAEETLVSIYGVKTRFATAFKEMLHNCIFFLTHISLIKLQFFSSQVHHSVVLFKRPRRGWGDSFPYSRQAR